MGSLDIKPDQTPTVLEPDETASIGSESMADSPTSSDKDECAAGTDATEHEKKAYGPDKKIFSFASCPSSISSSDSMLEDPFQDSNSEHSRSSLDSDDNDRLATEHGEKANEQLGDSEVPNSSLGPTPPAQVMERPPTQKYRIPSSVFARKKSTNPEWGMASNESLFSIQMGGMSFCNQDSMFWKSGELNLAFAAEPSTPGRLTKATEVGTIPELDETGKIDEDHELSEADNDHEQGEAGKSPKLDEEDKSHGSIGANEPVKPVLRDNREDQGSKSVADDRTSHFSAESGESTNSFAFPILTADADRHSTRTKSEPQLETLPESQPEAEKQPEPSGTKADALSAAPATTWTKWFPCFRCCTFCS